MHCRILNASAFFTVCLGEFHHEDGVLGGQANQHDHAQLRIYAKRHVAYCQADVGAQHGNGN